MSPLEIAGIIFGGLTVTGGVVKWITSIITKKNEEIEKKNKVIEDYRNDKLNGINSIEKEFENHLKESGGINNEKFIIMEKKVAVLEAEVGNIKTNLDEFKEQTKHDFKVVLFKIDKFYELQIAMSKEMSAMTEAIKTMKNGNQ